MDVIDSESYNNECVKTVRAIIMDVIDGESLNNGCDRR